MYIEEIKEKADIVTIVGEHVKLERRGSIYTGLCPFHHEKTASFTVFPTSATWHCFGCQKHGDVISFVQLVNNKSFMEAVKELGARYNVTLPANAQESEQRLRTKIVLTYAAEMYSEFLKGAPWIVDYLNKRVTPIGVQIGQLGYAPGDNRALQKLMDKFSVDDLVNAGLVKRVNGAVHSFFYNRIMIPIKNKAGQVCGFGARVLPDQDGPKFINSPSPAFEKGHMLYGMDKVTDVKDLVLVEGYFDSLACQASGYLNVVAIMGTALTEHQVRGLRGRITLALDSDSAGKEATAKSVMVACANHNLEIMCATLPEWKDPDDLVLDSPDIWESVINNAVPAIDYLIKALVSDKPDMQPSDRAEMARAFVPYWVNADEFSKCAMVDKLAAALHVGSDGLKRWFIKETSVKKPTVTEPKKTVVTQTDETVFLAAVLKHEEWLSSLNRTLRGLGLQAISEADFKQTESREVWRLIAAGLTDSDVPLEQYVVNHIGVCAEFLEGVRSTGDIVLDNFLKCGLRLRKAALQRLLKESVDLTMGVAQYRSIAQIDAQLRG